MRVEQHKKEQVAGFSIKSLSFRELSRDYVANISSISLPASVGSRPMMPGYPFVAIITAPLSSKSTQTIPDLSNYPLWKFIFCIFACYTRVLPPFQHRYLYHQVITRSGLVSTKTSRLPYTSFSINLPYSCTSSSWRDSNIDCCRYARRCFERRSRG